MKDWSDLEERYQDMRAEDPAQAEDFKKQMTERWWLLTEICPSMISTIKMENVGSYVAWPGGTKMFINMAIGHQDDCLDHHDNDHGPGSRRLCKLWRRRALLRKGNCLLCTNRGSSQGMMRSWWLSCWQCDYCDPDNRMSYANLTKPHHYRINQRKKEAMQCYTNSLNKV